MSSSLLSYVDSELTIYNNISTRELDKFRIVFFDIETGGFALTCDVLQIAMKCSESEFNMYINPSQDIPDQVTKINGLTNNGSSLYHRGVKLRSFRLKVVLDELLEYLQGMGTQCILVAHNCKAFDAPRLIKIIKEVSLLDDFRNVVAGFVDSLHMFRKKYPNRKSKGQCKLTTLASEILQVPIDEAHDAKFDVHILQNLMLHCFKPTEILENMQTFDCKLKQLDENKQTQIIRNTLFPLNAVISDEMRTKLAKAGITYKLLVDTYRKSKTEAVLLLQQSVNGKPQVIKTKRHLNIILQFLSKVTSKR